MACRGGTTARSPAAGSPAAPPGHTKCAHVGVPAPLAESAPLPASQFLPHARFPPIDFLLLEAFHEFRKSFERINKRTMRLLPKLLLAASLIIAWENIIYSLCQLLPSKIFFRCNPVNSSAVVIYRAGISTGGNTFVAPINQVFFKCFFHSCSLRFPTRATI